MNQTINLSTGTLQQGTPNILETPACALSLAEGQALRVLERLRVQGLGFVIAIIPSMFGNTPSLP